MKSAVFARARPLLMKAVLLVCVVTGGGVALPPQASHPGDKFYSDRPLGAFVGAATTFRVFAPTAKRVLVHLYCSPAGPATSQLELRPNADGTWENAVEGNLSGSFYTYSASGDDPGFDLNREVPDPYSRSVTACDGRSLIVSSMSGPMPAPRPKFPPQDAVIYEMHLRDFTIDPDSGVQRRGKYLGLTEAGTHLSGHPTIKTGLDHLSELGINTVQIMPFNEFASDASQDQYGWGYDAALYASPEGWYSSQPWNDSRIREAREMIDALHRRGIRVVMDMVLNHTEDALRKRAGSFEALVPGYYYRRRMDGSYFNGSGCGNEFRSEAPMARRFIKDILKFWVEEYRVDGFRFDLMGLMDKTTLVELTQELHAVDPNLLIYGEPWAAGETPIPVTAKGSQRGLGFAVFNDNFRDALKGSVFHAEARGFVQNGSHGEAVRKGIAGSLDDFAVQPTETINYVECHDNHTLWDRLKNSTPLASDRQRQSMDKLAAAILFTSQGIPFLQSGQEFLRTKHGDDNSYNKPDAVNMIRWAQKLAYGDIFRYYRGLIWLRKAHPLFHLANAGEIRHSLHFLPNLPPKVVGYTVSRPPAVVDTWVRALVVFNAAPNAQTLPIPAGRWQIFVDQAAASPHPLRHRVAGAATLPACSALILGEVDDSQKRGD